jgi:HK97 family phage major capsid protein
VKNLAGVLNVSNESLSDATLSLADAIGPVVADSLGPVLDTGSSTGQGTGANPEGVLSTAPQEPTVHCGPACPSP